ncbi:hypothetical protein NQ317_002728 [Molorchus minor]|uniref:Uncharacterized protein n=1 Tax=Molorchus minor TaxID=1323400 RepID=A0ABQ9K2N1_9CUCU|nr:hypothetical protein NQ317_002728 [Molorchus minor]
MFGEECRQIEIQDFPKICRTCLVHGDVKPLIDSKIAVTLKNVSDITLEDNDKLPQNLCNNCIKRLQDIFSFSENCKVSNVYLKSLLIEQEKKCFSDNASLDTFGHDVVDGASSSVREIKTPDSKAEYKESDCNEIRKSKRNLKKQHRKEKIRIKEEKPKRKRINEYSCDTCGKKFARQDGLKRHSKTHLGIKPFECGMCGKTFVEKATLNRHYLTHTGEKPFECNLCGKTTFRKDQIISHVTKHHPKAVDYDFVITEHKRDEAEIKELLKKVDVEQKSDVSDNAEGKMNTEQDPDSDIKEDSNEEVRQFKTRKRIEICLCNLCGKVFRRRGYLKKPYGYSCEGKTFPM